MDEFERELTRVLTRVGEQADPGFVRLRNPAHHTGPARRPSSTGPARRTRTGWTVAASGLAVAAMALGITVVAPRLGADSQVPAPPAAPTASSSTAPSPSLQATQTSVGKADGTHPLWPLTLAQTTARSYQELPTGEQVLLPLPRTLDPSARGADGAPTLVTGAGTIRFSPRESKSVTLLAQRDQGLFVVLNGAGNDGVDGFYDARFVVVASDNSRRQIHRAATATSFIVSPNGTLLAVNTGKAIELIDVASGKVEREMPGQLKAVSWVSEDTLLVGAEDGKTSRKWRAPWTGPTQPTSLPGGVQITPGGELIRLDPSTGCLHQVDSNATVTAANCGGWRTTPGAVSPDGRYLPLEWTTSGTVRRGVLDTLQNQIRTWPVNGWDPAWLGPDDVLLPEADARDSPGTARCSLSTATCYDVGDKLDREIWKGVAWLSGR
jgi:hypothetical protein